LSKFFAGTTVAPDGLQAGDGARRTERGGTMTAIEDGVESAARAADALAPTFATQAEAAYWRIRDDILSGALAPAHKLRLEGLRAHYGFGASPLREALSRLAAENLVTTLGQKGYWVAAISPAEFADIVSVRLFVEPEALARSIQNASLEWEGRVVAAFHRLSKVESALDSDRAALGAAWERENSAFHLALIENCGSPWLLRFASVLFEQSQRYRRQAISREAVPQERLQQEHLALRDAALKRNAGLACELLKLHIAGTADRLARTLFGA
jgi:DNA-binding GntR family transcriptional regulator